VQRAAMRCSWRNPLSLRRRCKPIWALPPSTCRDEFSPPPAAMSV
jgi:hypothetical protein